MCVLVLQAISEKNLAEPTAVELTETLHDTAAILSRQATCIWPPFFFWGGEKGLEAGCFFFFLIIEHNGHTRCLSSITRIFHWLQN
jgi:hypothetical protein